MRNPCGWLVVLLLASCMAPVVAMGQEDEADEEICTASTQSVEIEVARQQRAITLQEAERIILESGHSDAPELRLTFRLVTSEHLIVREIISLREEDGLWGVTGTSRQFAHRRPGP